MSATSIANLQLPPTQNGSEIPLQAYFKERRPEIYQLGEALQSGDLASAQQAYNNLVALGKQVLDKNNPFLRSDRAQDFNAIGGALQNGDLGGAQQALAALESTFKNFPPVTSAGASPVDVPAAVVNLTAAAAVSPSLSNANEITTALEGGVNFTA
jgi:hypothetical protein